MGGNADHGYLIMKNGSNIVGLFAGFIKSNTLTFNPGWDQNAQPVEDFEDVRAIQKRLKSEGIKLTIECDEATTGPAHLTLVDPDGNAILIDQHV
jgi:lactoylglutathione lyase